MITFKCKMCGGDLSFEQGSTIAECPYCGTTQTLPKLDDDKRANLYDRANHFRRQNEFDKAMAIYEQVLAEDRTDAEAYWSLVLCRYGIEYVEDPASHKRVPTVNRVQYASILADEDYKSALEHADAAQRRVYEAEANAIAEIQKGILDISRKEAPFDVFICYKETDANGRRTPDSVLANDMYHQLTKEGFKVFFSRITLEDKIGTAYEPYIFAALNSAKVMVVLGTKPEYFNAVWVKNEWSRYLALIRGGADKTLVPAYRDMDPYDLPEEFAHLQAQDMGKLGFMQDLIRGIKKILRRDEPKPQTVVQQTVAPANNAAPLVKRAFMSLEDGDFAKADDFCEQALNLDPENARAWLGKLMAQLKVRREGDLKNQSQPFDGNGNYQKTLRFGDEALKAQLKGDIEFINNRNEHDRQAGIFRQACEAIDRAQTVEECRKAREQLFAIRGFEGAEEKLKACEKKIENINDSNYRKALSLQQAGKWQEAIKGFTILKNYRYLDSAEKFAECEESIRANAYQKAEQLKDAGKWEEASRAFDALGSYRNSVKQAQVCRDTLEAEQKAEEQRRENERQAAEVKAKAKAAKLRNRMILILAVIAVIVAGTVLYLKVIKPNSIYNSALSAMNAGNYDEATEAFRELGDYKDAATQALESQYQKALALIEAGEDSSAYAVLFGLGDYKDAHEQAIDHIAQHREKLGDYARRLDAGYRNIVGLKSDGTVVAVGSNTVGQRDVGGWTDIVAVAADGYHTIGLKSDGSVVAVGSNLDGECDVDDWKEIVAVAAGFRYTVGLKSDGTVVDVGANTYSAVGDWTDIVAISAGGPTTVGLKTDGTVVVDGNNTYGGGAVGDWTDIVAVAAGGLHTVGLKSDGTVVAVGLNDDGQCDTGAWTDIVAVAADGYHTIGLKSDGTVVAVGNNDDGQCDTGAWTDIVAVAAGDGFTVGLKSDGTVVAVGNNNDGQCNTGDWKLWD